MSSVTSGQSPSAATLMARTVELVDIPSVSHHEQALADHLEGIFRALPGMEVQRHGDNLVARTHLARRHRLILAGHTDTVPADGNARAQVVGDVVHGLGSSDMKSGLAVLVELARRVGEPAVDLTFVFYAGEEVEGVHNGLGHLARDHPELLVADAAILGEPTGGDIEAGCQGSLRLVLTMAGRRAHAARPWMGINAVHRLGPVLRLIGDYQGRRPVLDGLAFAETLQAVAVEGGVAGNVVPDVARLTVNHRFAPDHDIADAEHHVRAVLAPALGPDDGIEVVDAVSGARPALDHPLLASLAAGSGAAVRAKLGWTDVARFAALGIPACNLGPGDPTLAHRADERAEGERMVVTYRRLEHLIRHGPDGSPR